MLLENSVMMKLEKCIAWGLGIFLIAMGFFFSGCGGGSTSGGGSTVGSGTPRTLSWSPPTSYTNNASLDPGADLDVFEIYVKQDANFTTSDKAMAAVNAVDSGTGQVTTSFDLNGLTPFLSSGTTYYVSVCAVAKNGMKSGFSQSAVFSF